VRGAQTPQWRKSLNGMLHGADPSGSPRSQILTAHLNSVKTLREAADPLYAVLSDDQKKVADSLMVALMGMV
jgi:hypothetical protein